jgi:O-antigen/teichoic acid export membrane protein
MSALSPSLRDRLLRSAFLQNAASLISGTVVTQLIVFACSPILSRFYSPNEMGSFANYTAWVAVLALVSSLRYEHAILVADGDEGADRALALTALLSAISAALFTVVAVVAHLTQPDIKYLREIRDVILYIPVGVLVVCFTSGLIQLNVRGGAFRRIATVTVVQSLVTIVVQVACGAQQFGEGLVIGVIAGYAVAGVLLARWSLGGGRLRALAGQMRREVLRTTALEHANFPRYTLGADAISVMAQQFTPVFITALFSPAAAGLYSFAVRVARVPLIIVSSAVASVLRKEAADRAGNPERLRALYRWSTTGLLVIAVVPFAVLVLMGPPMFRFVFGAEWAEAGRMARILSPGLALEFVALPLASFFLVTGTQRYSFRIQVAAFVALLGAVGIGRFWFNSIETLCALLAATMVGANVATIALAGRAARLDRSALAESSARTVGGIE